MDNIYFASIYRINAAIFRESAERLAFDFQSKKEKIVGNAIAIPFYYISSHTIELLMKCALLKRNVPMDDLKNYKLRHNLSNLLEKIVEMNIPISEKTYFLIEKLSKQHDRHQLRYTALVNDEMKTYTPDPKDIFLAMDELLSLTAISTHGR